MQQFLGVWFRQTEQREQETKFWARIPNWRVSADWNWTLTVIILNSLPDVLDIRRLAGIPDFISGDDMDEMICSGRLDPKVVFAYVQEVYRALKDN